jgi:hypothetical protein
MADDAATPRSVGASSTSAESTDFGAASAAPSL